MIYKRAYDLNKQYNSETVYTPQSLLKSPFKLAREMWQDLLVSRELGWRLATRDIKARYRQSALGIVWAFLPAIATAGLFIVLNKASIIKVEQTSIPYPAFVMVGTLLWQIFLDGLNAPIKSISSSKSILVKINFPREALIVSAMLQAIFDICVKLLVLIAVLVIFQINLTWWVLLAPLAIVMLVMLGFMVGLALTPISILYTDISMGMGTFTTLWLFATPVVYPIPTNGTLATLIKINPVTPILVPTRDLITTGTFSYLTEFTVISALVVIGLLAMWIIYRISVPILIERISS